LNTEQHDRSPRKRACRSVILQPPSTDRNSDPARRSWIANLIKDREH